MDPYYVRFDGTTIDPLAEKILYIVDHRLTSKGCNTTAVDVLMNNSGTVIEAWREDVIIVPTSKGGGTDGVQIPFQVYRNGNRVKGTFNMATKTFTAGTGTD